MQWIRQRLTYANVVASLALFLVIAGGSAFAATQLAKNSVGSKQLKSNAVTSAKIKKNAVTAAKIKSNAVTTAKLKNAAVTGAKIKDGAITGSEINPATTPFTRMVATVSRDAVVPAAPPAPYLIGTYTQPAGQLDTFVGSVIVNFPDACKAPRTFQAYYLVDPANPATPSAFDLGGVAVIEDKVGGNLTKQVTFAPFAGGFAQSTSAPSSANVDHSFYVYPLGASCTSGSGITIQSAKVNVLGTPGG